MQAFFMDSFDTLSHPKGNQDNVAEHENWVALFSTDLDLSIKQIIQYYGARWKIESGFKEIKQEIGSSKSQTRNAHAVSGMV